MKKIIPLLILSMLVLTACETKVVQPIEVSTTKVQASEVPAPTPTKKQNNPIKESSSKTAKNFSNSKCNYSFNYPEGSELLSNEPIGFVDESPDVFINLKGEGRLINISCYSANEDLKSYAQKNGQDNKDDIAKVESLGSTKNVGDLSEIKFQDEEAYQFTLIGSYKYPNDGGGEVLKNPTTVIFVKHNNFTYEIAYLTDNKKSEEILNSFKFTEVNK